MALAFSGRVVRALWPHLVRGRVIVCDRYVLDAWVQIGYQHGVRNLHPQLAILRLLCPTPRAAFLLDIPPETASHRKSDFEPAQNARRAELYREGQRLLRMRTVDATRPSGEISAELARTAWRTLLSAC
jgi:thymidylate kinase